MWAGNQMCAFTVVSVVGGSLIILFSSNDDSSSHSGSAVLTSIEQRVDITQFYDVFLFICNIPSCTNGSS